MTTRRNSANDRLAIFGPGGFGREVSWLLANSKHDRRYEFVGYVDDDPTPGRTLNGTVIFPWNDFVASRPAMQVVIAVGDPSGRRAVAARCTEAGFRFATTVHRSVEMSDSVLLGHGAIICAGAILTVDIDVGAHVHVNLDCTIGHDVRIGSYSTLSPGVHVSGNVHIGDSVYVGTGATIINGRSGSPLVIGSGAVIAAGACVTSDVEGNAMYAGVPAQLKKRY